MLKNRLKKLLPNHSKLAKNKSFRLLGNLIYNPNLWHFTRYSVATAFSIGFFAGWLPIPGHMLVAAGLAILFKANLPLSVLLVWFNNPLTMGFFFYFSYKLGAFILVIPYQPFEFKLSLDWILHAMHDIGWPLLAGCLFMGGLTAIISNVAVRLLWRYSVIKHWRSRKASSKKNV